RVLAFFPESAYFTLTGMSERALVFIDTELRHRILVLLEAEAMAGDMQSYFLRTLLSEGSIRYQFNTKGDGGEIGGRTGEVAGPTGLLVTTPAVSLHRENETRLMSATVADTKEQTKAVLLALADEREEPIDFESWHALQGWLALGEHRVTIPYA